MNGITTTYTLDLNTGLTQVLSESAPQGYGTSTYVYGLGRIAQVNTTTEYFLGDALGSVRQLANSGGSVVLAKAYTPYGETRSSVGSGTSSFAFTGEQQDASGLTYLRARYYASGTGRFLTRDTWGGDANNPMSLNRWNYVHSNPIMFTDPTGHIELWEAEEAHTIVTDLKYNYQIEIITDWGSFESGTNKFIGLLPVTIQYMEANGIGYCNWVIGLWTLKDLRAIHAGVHIMDKGVSFLGGDFKSLIGKVKIEQMKSYNATPSDSVPRKINWRYQNTSPQEYGLYTIVHEMGHIVMFHEKKKLDYFMSKLGAHCDNQPFWRTKGFYCNEIKQPGVDYDPGPFAGDVNNPVNNPTKYMPSVYATRGSYEDFADTWREVVVKAYIDSGDTAYILEANLLYAYLIKSHDIGQRRIVMTSIIDGSWK